MTTQPLSAEDAFSSEQKPRVYQNIQVDVNESVGILFLGFLAIFLFLALRRSERRNRALIEHLASLGQPLPD
jgi:hypothetical protein